MLARRAEGGRCRRLERPQLAPEGESIPHSGMVMCWRATTVATDKEIETCRATDATTTFRSPAAGAMHALVADHVVRARVVLPGAAYLELARAAWCALASASPPTRRCLFKDATLA